MEIRPEEIKNVTENPYDLFFHSINNQASKKLYVSVLKKLVCEYLKFVLKGDPSLVENTKPVKKRGVQRKYSDADFEVRVNEFLKRSKSNPEWAESVMIALAKKLMERARLPIHDSQHIQYSTIQNTIKTTKKLFKINNIPMFWTRIDSMLSNEHDIKDKSRGYTRDEIQRILKHCKPMDAVIVYLGASSGMRAGAFPLKWGHIFPIYQHENQYVWEPEDVTESISEKCNAICGLVKVYADSNDEYFAFTTPECLNAIQLYKETWIKETNKIPKLEDPLFKKSGPFVRQLSLDGIRKRMLRLVESSGVRKHIPGIKEKYEVPLFNGLRRFFNKANKQSFSKQSKLASLILKETMMGHSGLIKLDKNYFKEHIDELIEEYVQSIPFLTISDEERLILENQKINKEKSELEITRAEMEEMKREMRLIKKYGKILPQDQ